MSQAPEGGKIEFNAADLESRKAEDYKDIYTNYVRAGHTPWDVSFTCATLDDMGSKSPPIIMDRVAIRMSPAHFKAFISVLMQTLEAYERQYGTISVPENKESVGKS